MSKKTPKKSLIHDKVNPKDARELTMIFACEQCSFFDHDNKNCLMGFPSEPHLFGNQIKRYNLTGRMAICRFLEID